MGHQPGVEHDHMVMNWCKSDFNSELPRSQHSIFLPVPTTTSIQYSNRCNFLMRLSIVSEDNPPCRSLAILSRTSRPNRVQQIPKRKSRVSVTVHELLCSSIPYSSLGLFLLQQFLFSLLFFSIPSFEFCLLGCLLVLLLLLGFLWSTYTQSSSDHSVGRSSRLLWTSVPILPSRRWVSWCGLSTIE